MYDRAYDDFRAGNLNRESFQKLVTIEIYSGRFNHTWIYWFFIQPILSSALGIIAFFIARSGLGVMQGASADAEISIRSLYMYAVFTFLAGFSSHKFIAWLDALADKIFAVGDMRSKIQAEVRTSAANDRLALKEEVGESAPVPASEAPAEASGAEPSEVPAKRGGESAKKPMKPIR